MDLTNTCVCVVCECRVWSFQPNPSTIASTMSKSVLTSLEWANKADRLVC